MALVSRWAERARGDGHVLSRIAVITDIHANLLALEACLSAIDSLDVDAVFCGGDLVGYGPRPNEVATSSVTVPAQTRCAL